MENLVFCCVLYKQFSAWITVVVLLLCHGGFSQKLQTFPSCTTYASSELPTVYPESKLVNVSGFNASVSEWSKLVFKDCKVQVGFYCKAAYPIEWVEEPYNHQNIDALTDTPNHIKKSLWSERLVNETLLQQNGKFASAIDNPDTTTYIAFLGIKNTEKSLCVAANYTCRSVSNHCLQYRVASTSDTTKRIIRYEHSNDFYDNTSPQNDVCNAIIEVAVDREHGRVGWRCTGSSKTYMVPHIRTCDAAIHCNSYFNHYRNQNCVKRLATNQWCDNCLYQNRTGGFLRHAGYIFCGDKNQETVYTAAHYFFSVRQSLQNDSQEIPDLYLHWHESNPQKMLYLEPIQGDIYLNEFKTVICKISRYYFSFGHRFGFEYKNGTMRFSPSLDGEHDLRENVNTMKINVSFTDPELNRIYCFAPVWNSSVWVNQSIEVDLKDDGSPPKFFGHDNHNSVYEKVTFDLHKINASLTCRAHGKPTAKIKWIYKRNDGLKIEETEDNDGTKYLIFPYVTNQIGGEYRCEANNYLGKVTKVFAVRVRDRFADYVLASTIMGAVFLLIFMAVVGRCWLKVKQQKNLLRTMTDAEVIKFREGNLDVLKSSEYLDTQELLHALPYNDEYEIPSRCLYVDPSEILGSGNFGQVLKGTFYDKNDRMKCKVVAVKTTKPKYDFSYFQTLLTEVKIMAYIGKHPNIVGLVGACTANIKKGQIYIAVEFCAKGSLEKFLKNNRSVFINKLCGKYITTSFCSVQGLSFDTDSEPSPAHLLKWSREIANGMEFLESKKIVHGDLASRNVLLTNNLVAKVGDFGLSRVIMTYSSYIRSTQEECFLAFKWMAPETLHELKFSAMSDVWSYGVTLWEIFSLAQHPYSGITYSSEFLELLQSGHRLNKPVFANSQIYNLMMDCWQLEPSQRVTFTDIKDFFENLLMQTCNEDYVQTKCANDTTQYINGSHNFRVHNPGYTMFGTGSFSPLGSDINENTNDDDAKNTGTPPSQIATQEDSQGYLQPLLSNFESSREVVM